MTIQPIISASTFQPCQWDIFCRVIDNLGDIGVCWRLSVQLAQRGQQVRLWTDQAGWLDDLAPDGCTGVCVLPWTDPLDADMLAHLTRLAPCDVMVEAFGCEIAPEFIAIYASHLRTTHRSARTAIWINLEYLSAEPMVERCHKLPSWVQTGPGAGLTKHFFYPGWTKDTGGLLRETDLLDRQNRFDREQWLSRCLGQGAEPMCASWQGRRLISLFCYEPAALGDWLAALANDTTATCILVTHGRATWAVQSAIAHLNDQKPLWNERGVLSFFYLPMLSQTEFDHLLWACDVNLVRGEDSLVRAIWAGKPLVWQIYPQDDGVHRIKLDAWLHWLGAPASLCDFHHAWNGFATNRSGHDLPPFVPDLWQTSFSKARHSLLQQPDLVSSLLEFVSNWSLFSVITP